MNRFRLTPEQRITKRMDYQSIYKNGKRVNNDRIRIYLIQSELNRKPRLGIAIDRKINKAVLRNRIKRQIREIFRLHQFDIKPGSQIVIMAKPLSIELNYRQLEEIILKSLDKLNIMDKKKES